MTSPTMFVDIDPEVIEQSLRLAAANQAMVDAERDGYTRLRSGLYLNSQESITAEQDAWIQEGDPVYDFSQASYWLTTDDGQVPTPIYGVDDLVDYVDIDDQLEKVLATADRRESLTTIAQDARPQVSLALPEEAMARHRLEMAATQPRPQSDLASPDDYLARRNRGRAM